MIIGEWNFGLFIVMINILEFLIFFSNVIFKIFFKDLFILSLVFDLKEGVVFMVIGNLIYMFFNFFDW